MTPIEFRRHLHAHPELSFAEQETAHLIEEQLAAAAIPTRRIASTGVLATIEGRGDRHRAVVLRADIDALPITELSEVAWRSQNTGVMHACGHDMHAAVLYGVLLHLAATRDFEGTIFGLFQPGEECNPGGASLVLAENPFEGYQIEAVIGEHVEPQLAVGTLGFRAGKYMAANDELRLKVQGRGGHAALRGELHDPVGATAQLITELLALNTEECVLSIGKVEAAGATNVIPDNVSLEGTLRTFDEENRKNTKEKIETLAAQIDSQHRTHTLVDINTGYPCVVNDAALTEQATHLAAQQALGIEMLPLRTTAEDFGYYGTRYPSLFYRLGVGTAAGRTHTAQFNPDEGAINIGIAFMETLAVKILNR
ncbi:MAG: M20 family metallopeptidase [Alistipes sp.]